MDLSAAAGPAARRDKETTRRTVGQEDRRKGGRVGEGGRVGKDGDVPCAIYPAVIQRGIPFALASRTEGGMNVCFFSPYSVGSPGKDVADGRAEGGGRGG